MTSSRRGPAARGYVAILAVTLLLVGACTSSDSVEPLPESAQEIVDSSAYDSGGWSWYAADLTTGEPVFASAEDKLTLLGSTTKLFTVGTYFQTFGADDTWETPVYATGGRNGKSLDGDLVLVGSGDFVLGSRGVETGDIQFTSPDHIYFYATPLAKPVEADPLAGLDDLAAQVAKSGIKSVDGDVLVDGRLWEPFETKEGVLTPIMVNDNLLDIQLRPGAETGDPAEINVRPDTEFFDVVNKTVTTSADGAPTITTEAGRGNKVIVRGELPLESEPFNTAYFAPDPAAYARALFIEALARAGVTVGTPLAVQVGSLPAADSYNAKNKVAAIESPPASLLGKLVLKTSHNRGAESMLCLLAVNAGETDCESGLLLIQKTIADSGLDPNTVFMYDGEGSDPASATPRAMIKWLTWASQQPWIDSYREALPDNEGNGKILTKSGTSARPDIGTMPSLFPAEAQAGYIETDDGRHLAVAVFLNNGVYPTVSEGLHDAKADTEAVLVEIQKNG